MPVELLAADAGMIRIEKTHGIHFSAEGSAEAMLPISLDPGIDLCACTFFVSEASSNAGENYRSRCSEAST